MPAREVDHQPFDGAEIGTRHGANRRSGWDRSTSTPGGHEPRAVGDELPLDFTDLPSDRMVVAPAELNSEGHHHTSDVAAAENRVAPGHRYERADRVRDVADQRAHFRVPGLPDPFRHRQREVLFAGEEVVQGTSRVTGLRRHSLQDQV